MGYGIEGTDGSSCAAVRQTRRGRCLPAF